MYSELDVNQDGQISLATVAALLEEMHVCRVMSCSNEQWSQVASAATQAAHVASTLPTSEVRANSSRLYTIT
jgi:hypothetical protein